MTVAELIAKLQQYKPEARVVVYDPHRLGYTDFVQTEEDNVEYFQTDKYMWVEEVAVMIC